MIIVEHSPYTKKSYYHNRLGHLFKIDQAAFLAGCYDTEEFINSLKEKFMARLEVPKPSYYDVSVDIINTLDGINNKIAEILSGNNPAKDYWTSYSNKHDPLNRDFIYLDELFSSKEIESFKNKYLLDKEPCIAYGDQEYKAESYSFNTSEQYLVPSELHNVNTYALEINSYQKNYIPLYGDKNYFTEPSKIDRYWYGA